MHGSASGKGLTRALPYYGKTRSASPAGVMIWLALVGVGAESASVRVSYVLSPALHLHCNEQPRCVREAQMCVPKGNFARPLQHSRPYPRACRARGRLAHERGTAGVNMMSSSEGAGVFDREYREESMLLGTICVCMLTCSHVYAFFLVCRCRCVLSVTIPLHTYLWYLLLPNSYTLLFWFIGRG